MKVSLSFKLTWLTTVLVLASIVFIAFPTLKSESKELKKSANENAVMVMKNAEMMIQDFIEDPANLVESAIKYLETGASNGDEIELFF